MKSKPKGGEQSPEQNARRVATGLLARREHSAFELQRKLQSRGVQSALIEQLIEELQQENLLSDVRFTEQFVRSRSERGSGPVKIRLELQERGVNDKHIDATIQALARDWVRAAAQVREKKFGKTVPSDYTEQAKQARFLQSRGFTAEQIRKALKFEFS
ncbi:MAG: recombination regulator RecX [Gammaproteobacteria bacterium]|nr:recombination regulator RecX [Gammaproteobacteria bacterium]